MPEAICCCGRRHWHTHAYKVSSPCVVPLASLRSEDVILRKVFVVVVMETMQYTCAPISPPCLLQFVSLRSEEVVLKKQNAVVVIAWKWSLYTARQWKYAIYTARGALSSSCLSAAKTLLRALRPSKSCISIDKQYNLFRRRPCRPSKSSRSAVFRKTRSCRGKLKRSSV